MSFDPSPDESERACVVFATLIDYIQRGETIRLPAFDPAQSMPSTGGPLLSVGVEANPFGGTAGAYLYQFEGEEDLLHLFVTRSDGGSLTPEEGVAVARWLLPNVPPALVWLKPGEFSQHFYVGHDDLLPTGSRE
ncbi:MAG: hypothetical protein K1X67_04870 [Fimbriimonadaceae bacterium]|nr:hypothetical protein [Fimbriimonadaceae bacterium]